MPPLAAKTFTTALRAGKSHRRWLIDVMLILPYDKESQSRNADFISIAAERQSATLGAKGPVKLKNPWAEGPSILRTFFRHALQGVSKVEQDNIYSCSSLFQLVPQEQIFTYVIL